MIAILSADSENIKRIKGLTDKEVIYSNIYKNLQEEIEKVLRLNLEILIIDTISYIGDLTNSIKKMRMLENNLRIILITDKKQGDKQISDIVKMGVYDIITDIERLPDIIDNKMIYLQASKWEIENIEKLEEKTKIVIEQNLIGTALIGVTALKAGSGATHLATQLATFLSQRKYKTAVIEVNTNNKSLKEMKRIYETTSIEKENGDLYEKNIGFRLGRIDFYPFNEVEIAEIFKRNYQYIIFDFGKYDLSSDIYRCKVKIMTANIHLWEDKLLQEFIAEEENLDTWNLCTNAEIKRSEFLKDKKLSIFNKVQSKLFEISEQEEEIYEKLLKDVIVVENKKQRGFNLKKFFIKGDANEQEK